MLVTVHNGGCLTFRHNSPVFQPNSALAELLYQSEYVRDDYDACAVILEFVHTLQALLLEKGVSHGKHLIYQQDFRFAVDGNGEAETHVHSRGVALDRRVDEIP